MRGLGVEGVEMTGGGWSKGPHFRADQLLADKGLLKTKLKEIETRGLEIAALNCSAIRSIPARWANVAGRRWNRPYASPVKSALRR
jgi:hypothetical protein